MGSKHGRELSRISNRQQALLILKNQGRISRLILGEKNYIFGHLLKLQEFKTKEEKPGDQEPAPSFPNLSVEGQG